MCTFSNFESYRLLVQVLIIFRTVFDLVLIFRLTRFLALFAAFREQGNNFMYTFGNKCLKVVVTFDLFLGPQGCVGSFGGFVTLLELLIYRLGISSYFQLMLSTRIVLSKGHLKPFFAIVGFFINVLG